MDFNSCLLQEALLKIMNQREQPQLISSTIKNILHCNNLAIRPIPEGGSNLMRAVSDCLYFTTSKYQEIQTLCFKYLKKLFQSKKLTRNLTKFYDNFQFLSDYCNNPELSIFDDNNQKLKEDKYCVQIQTIISYNQSFAKHQYTNKQNSFRCLNTSYKCQFGDCFYHIQSQSSCIFRNIKYLAYLFQQVGDDSYLNSKQFNSRNHTKIIQLLWDDGIYTPVYEEAFLENARMAQNLVYEILGKVLGGELVNPDNEFVNIEYQHWLDKENKRENTSSPYKFPSSAEGLTIKRSYSQQNLKENEQIQQQEQYKEFQPAVGYHNLKTANERMITQGGKQQKFFTFNMNDCNDDYEETNVIDEPKRKFFTEFLDPLTNLLLHQSEESQECAPISPIGYKQLMHMQTQQQQQQQQHLHHYGQFASPQVPMYPYANAAPPQHPNTFTQQPKFNYLATPYLNYDEFQQPSPQMSADYQHVSETWNSPQHSQQQQQQMHHYQQPYTMRYPDYQQIIYPQHQQQSPPKQPFGQVNSTGINEQFKNRLVVPQKVESSQQQPNIGGMYFHPTQNMQAQGQYGYQNIPQTSYLSTPPLQNFHQNQTGSVENLNTIGSSEKINISNNDSSNNFGRKPQIQTNYSNNEIQLNLNKNSHPILENDPLYPSQDSLQYPNMMQNQKQPQYFRPYQQQPSQQQQYPNQNIQNIAYNQNFRVNEQQQSPDFSSDDGQKQRKQNQQDYVQNNPSNNMNINNNRSSFNNTTNKQSINNYSQQNSNNQQNFNSQQNNFNQYGNQQINNKQNQKNQGNNPQNFYQQNNNSDKIGPNQQTQPRANNYAGERVQNDQKNINNSGNNSYNKGNNKNTNTNYNNNQTFNNNQNNDRNNNSFNNYQNTQNKETTTNTSGQTNNMQKQKDQDINQDNNNLNNDEQSKLKQPKQPEVLEQTDLKKKGRLKFFDTSNNFGFFNMDEDSSDVFVHLDDLSTTTVPKELLKHSSLMNLRFQFHFIKYIGKHKQSRKAIDIEYLPDESNETITQAPSTPSSNQTSNKESISANTNTQNFNSGSSLSPDKNVQRKSKQNQNGVQKNQNNQQNDLNNNTYNNYNQRGQQNNYQNNQSNNNYNNQNKHNNYNNDNKTNIQNNNKYNDNNSNNNQYHKKNNNQQHQSQQLNLQKI